MVVAEGYLGIIVRTARVGPVITLLETGDVCGRLPGAQVSISGYW